MNQEEPWYALLREQWRPEQVRLLLIAESPPAPREDGKRRFFYADGLGPDNLFRSVVLAMYGVGAEQLRTTGKRPWLKRLQQDGVFLIDLAPIPVNTLKSGERKRILRESVPDCVRRARTLEPEGIVIVKAPLYKILAQPLRDAGLPLLHEDPMVFPLGNTREQFVRQFNAARTRLS